MPVPSVVVPSLNVTVPVADALDKVAVNVTDCPDITGLGLALSVVEVITFELTIKATADEALVLLTVSPP